MGRGAPRWLSYKSHVAEGEEDFSQLERIVNARVEAGKPCWFPWDISLKPARKKYTVEKFDTQLEGYTAFWYPAGGPPPPSQKWQIAYWIYRLWCKERGIVPASIETYHKQIYVKHENGEEARVGRWSAQRLNATTTKNGRAK